MNRIGALIVVLVVLLGCSSTKKTNVNPEELAAFKRFVENGRFEFNATAAFPLQTQAFTSVANSGLLQPGSNSGRIDLTGNPSYIKIMGDSISAYLPYFGERRVSGGYGANTDISFNGRVKDYEIVRDSLKHTYKIDFRMEQNTEVYDVHLTVFPSRNANLSLNSTQRSTIRYDGVVQELTETKVNK
ncbi:DUF4251 domain-containing protein [Maribacter sp. R77961]|uniref:DUF4251 domain-containing protein n=1 Tax=Maribacter sp. R77961 TaxID=3093871 RepID=UPI0037CC246F